MPEINEVVDLLNELKDDSTIPKNVKGRIDDIIMLLNGTADTSLNVNKALDMLDEIGDDVNLQPFARTQVWNVVSMLEMF